ncbi:MAG: PD-(D/E)XK nuclease family protein [Candidatus Odinarchaeia archaeon]|nr:MAG: pd-d/exk nuclease-like protein [Lokiarchaeota virus Fenrir Meg22_1012]URC17234.1 MAG: pd-d/exk nuclease-like protein [Lokiarchaeota virus Fenrir Meg22_1214]
MEYIDKPFPWVSKSKLKSIDFCKYEFYLRYIKGEKPEYDRRKSIEGTNLHMVFANFFRHLKPEHVFRDEFLSQRTPISQHPFRRFIYEACMRFVKPTQRNWGKYKNIISNFATIETERWVQLNSFLTSKNEIFDCFKPFLIERRIEYNRGKLFGTIDRVNIEVMLDGTKKVAIYDYKTGNTPLQIKNYRSIGDPFGWRLRADLMREIHFYGLLYLLAVGWKLSDEVLEFINDPKYWTVGKNEYKKKKQYLTNLKDKYKPYKIGKFVKKGDILLGFYYLSGERGFRPTKEFNYASYKSVLLAINEYRSMVYNKNFIRHPSEIFDEKGCKFKNCFHYDRCKEMVERKY